MTNLEILVSAFNIAPVPYLIMKVNPLYEIVWVNRTYKKVLNKTDEELIGKILFEVFPDINNNLSKVIEAIDKVLKKKESCVTELQYDIIDNGNIIIKYWNLEYTPIINNNEVEYLLQSTRDITNLVIDYGYKVKK